MNFRATTLPAPNRDVGRPNSQWQLNVETGQSTISQNSPIFGLNPREQKSDRAKFGLTGFTNSQRAILESGMAHISGFERDQLLLLPEAVDDYVGSDNPVRFIAAFVDGLDLVEAGFGRVQPKATGRPGYAPGDLLKLCIYGYLNRVRSSRRLEAECHRNIEVIWLLRTLKPDFKTIADFRADNRAEIRPFLK